MSSIEIKEVKTKKELKQFIQFYYDLYRDSEYAVPYLYMDEMDTLRKDKNPSFECCEAAYYMAFKDGKMVGRVAAIINHRANENWNRKCVRFGWFDFVDDIEVSEALLKTVEEWGLAKGMNEITGPLGFTDMDREGMLIEGFEEQSTMYVNYNYPYYKEHMERMAGFAKDNDYMEYKVRVPDEPPYKYGKLADMISQRYNLKVHKFTRKELIEGGMGRKVFEIVNETYSHLYNYSHMSDKQIDGYVNNYIKIADLNLVSSVFDENTGEMVAIGVTFPSFTKALQHTRDGRMLPMGWWELLKVLKWHKTDTVDLLLIGVLPEYRKKGANSLIFNDLIKQFVKYGFKWAEAMPQMEDNKAVQSEWQYLESRQHRRHRCYTKSLR